jgi:hypothetical protein
MYRIVNEKSGNEFNASFFYFLICDSLPNFFGLAGLLFVSYFIHKVKQKHSKTSSHNERSEIIFYFNLP